MMTIPRYFTFSKLFKCTESGDEKLLSYISFDSSVDPTEALTLPGVHIYLDANDVPGSNTTGMIALDEEVFATDEVCEFSYCIFSLIAKLGFPVWLVVM